MDKIIIQGLKLHSLIGVYDWERLEKQALLVDAHISLDLSGAAESDDVANTIDYAELADVLVNIADKSEFQLLEALADCMIKAVFERYPAVSITLRISKPDILENAQCVSVELSREI